MIQLTGKNNTTVDIMLDEVEESVVTQLYNMLNSGIFENSKVVIQPDTHMGKGSVVGLTATIEDRVCPNVVGVDIGCVDKNTEFLTPTGWKKISEYNGEKICVYNLQSNESYFETPINYIVLPEDKFIHLKNKYGVNQLLSEEHTVLYFSGRKGRTPNTITAKELYDKHNKNINGFRGKFLSTIPNLKTDTKLNISNEILRLYVMVSADFSINDSKLITGNFKKQRKIDRIEYLLSNANIKYSKTAYENGCTRFSFRCDEIKSTNLKDLYEASAEQRSIILDEVQYWDSDIKSGTFNTTIKENADFIQYIMATNNLRSSIIPDNRETINYRVCKTKNTYTSITSAPKTQMKYVESEDKLKYCFTTSTGYWIMRCNDSIVVTGNCGIYSWNLGKINPSLEMVDNFIRKEIPYGFGINDRTSKEYNQRTIKSIFKNDELKQLCDFVKVDYDKVLRSIGSLGGGNHFIELGIDPDDNIWLSIHSGSRNFGLQVATFFQKMAKAKCDEKGLHVAKDLEYLMLEDGGDKYLEAMKVAQTVAHLNRIEMASRIIDYLKVNPAEWIHSVHNYIDLTDKIIRKGAIRAMQGEKVVIPFNMRDGIAVATGKGNSDWNYSAPHGAGRILSRSQAKRELDLQDYKKDMDGIYSTCVTNSTLDESPRVYKDKDLILNAIVPTVQVDFLIKPIYNFKGN